MVLLFLTESIYLNNLEIINEVLIVHQFNKDNYQNRILQNFYLSYSEGNFRFNLVVLKILGNLRKAHHFFEENRLVISS